MVYLNINIHFSKLGPLTITTTLNRIEVSSQSTRHDTLQYQVLLKLKKCHFVYFVQTLC